MTDTEKTGSEQNQIEDEGIIDVEVIETSSSDRETDAETPKKSSAGKPWGWLTATALMLFIAGIFTAPYAREGLITIGILPNTPQETGQTDGLDETGQEIASLRDEIDRLKIYSGQQEATLQALRENLFALEGSIETLKTTDAAATPTPALSSASVGAVEDLKRDVSRLSEDLTRLASIKSDAGPDSARLDSAIAVTSAETAALNDRVRTLESALEAIEAGRLETSPRGRLVLQLSRIKDKALTGLAYGADLAGLRADLAALPALDQQAAGADLLILERHGGMVAPFDRLLEEFDQVATDIVRAQEKADGSFLEKLFTVRRRDAGASGLDAQLYNAERRLYARDLEGAIIQLEGLEGPAGDAASLWLSKASAHLETRKAFDSLIARIAGRTGV